MQISDLSFAAGGLNHQLQDTWQPTQGVARKRLTMKSAPLHCSFAKNNFRKFAFTYYFVFRLIAKS